MPNAYLDLTSLKASGALNISGSGDDTTLRLLLEAISRACDDFIGRRMYSRTATLYFPGNGKNVMLLPDDLIAITTLKEDEDQDGATYETTWAATDYILAPYYATPTDTDPDKAFPYWGIEVDRTNQGNQSAFGKGQKRFELVGKWGYSESTKDTGNDLNDAALTAAGTSLAFDGGGDALAPGMTLMLGSEQMYVTAGITTPVTVERGVNGTTAAAHADDTDIYIVQYPSALREAVKIETARLWTMKASGFASQVGNQDTGVVQVFGGELHARARALLNPFRRIRL